MEIKKTSNIHEIRRFLDTKTANQITRFDSVYGDKNFVQLKTIGDLLAITEKDFLVGRKIGKWGLNAVRNFLSERGWRFKNDNEIDNGLEIEKFNINVPKYKLGDIIVYEQKDDMHLNIVQSIITEANIITDKNSFDEDCEWCYMTSRQEEWKGEYILESQILYKLNN